MADPSHSHSPSAHYEKAATHDEKAATTVLVCLETNHGSRNREVTFEGHKEELIQKIKTEFSDILVAETTQIVVQIRDETWGQGMFVDLMKQAIPNRAVIKAIQIVSKKTQDHEVGVSHTPTQWGLATYSFSIYGVSIATHSYFLSWDKHSDWPDN